MSQEWRLYLFELAIDSGGIFEVPRLIGLYQRKLLYMRKASNIFFGITVILVVGTLMFIAFASYPQNSGVSLGSAQQGTLAQERATTIVPAYPPPFTPTVGPTLPLPPSPTPDLVIPSPTTFPTAVAGLPNGSNVIFAETTNGGLTVWAASAIDSSQRVILARIDRSVRGFNGSISPNQQHLAIVATEALNSRINASLYVAKLNGDKFSTVATDIALGRYQNYPAWSSDSRYVAILRQSNTDFPYDQSMSVIDIETGKETTVAKVTITNAIDEAGLSIYPLDWSSDGRYLYFQKGSYDVVELWRYDFTSGDTVKVNDISSVGIPRCYYLSPDDASLLCLTTSKDLRSYSVNLVSTLSSVKNTIFETIAADEFSDPIWSPDGTKLALGVFDSTLKKAQANVVSLQDSKIAVLPIRSGDAGNNSAFPVSWSPDGVWLLVNVVGDAQEYYLVNADGKGEAELILPNGATVLGWINAQVAR